MNVVSCVYIVHVCTCVYMTVLVSVWVGGRHTSQRSAHVHPVHRKWAEFPVFLFLSSFFCRSSLWSSLVTASPWVSTVIPWRHLLLKGRKSNLSCSSRYVHKSCDWKEHVVHQIPCYLASFPVSRVCEPGNETTRWEHRDTVEFSCVVCVCGGGGGSILPACSSLCS